MVLAGRACEVIDREAPAYWPAAYPWAVERSAPGFDFPRKLGRGILLIQSCQWGFWVFGTLTAVVVVGRWGGVMFLLTAYLLVGASAVLGAVAGGLIGYGMGAALPGYYRGVFASGREPWFDPVHVGVGLGITQGLLAGLAVGAVVVLAWALVRSRGGLVGKRPPDPGCGPER
jgi:hypothetical protein